MDTVLINKAIELDRIQQGAINESATYERLMRLKKWTLESSVNDDDFVSLALFIPDLDYKYIY